MPVSAHTAERNDVRAALHVAAPPLVPLDQVIDRDHLARMTQGDRALEREVLQLFAMQAEMLLDRMRQATPKAAAALAHTLNGSARGIGAWQVVEAAEAVERASVRGGDMAGRFRRLSDAVAALQDAVAQILRAPA